jgi:peptidoglycan hydrolase CwlO-like protein
MIGEVFHLVINQFGSIKMSDAMIALISAIITSIGLTLINRMLSTPSEHWKQAAEIRDELRNDLKRAQGELEMLRGEIAARDREILELREQILELNTELKKVKLILEEYQSRSLRIEDSFN